MRLFAFSLAAFAALCVPASSMTPVPNDEVLGLLPADISVYAGIEDFRNGYDEGKFFVDRIAPGGKLFADLEKQIDQLIAEMPEQLEKSTRAGLKKLVSAHFAFTGDGRVPILVVRLDDAELMSRLVYEDLKPMSTETIKVGDHKVMMMSPNDWPREIGYLAVVNNIGICTGDLDVLKDMLARSDGRDTKVPGLKGTDLYKKLSTRTDAKITFRAWANLPKFIGSAMGSSYYGGRYSKYRSDSEEAIFGFSAIQNVDLEMTLSAGKGRSKIEVSIGETCRMYHDLWKQKAGPKSLLKFVPADAAVAAHVNIESGPVFYKALVKFIKRADEIYGAQHGNQNRNRNTEDEMNRELEREMGFTVKDCADVIGNEITGFLAPADWANFPRTADGLGFVGRITNVEKARELAGKIKNGREFSRFEWKEKVHNDVTISYCESGHEFSPAWAIDGEAFIFASGVETVQKALDAKGGKNLADKAKWTGSKVAAVNFKAAWQMMAGIMGGDLPPWHEMMAENIYDFAMIEDGETGISVQTHDSLGAAAFISALPFFLVVEGADRMNRRSFVPQPIDRAIPVKKVPKVDLPKDADKAKEFIEEQLDDLGSEQLFKREEAEDTLKGIGQPAVKAVAAYAQEVADAEVQARCKKILLYLKAYDAMPGLIDAKVGTIVAEIQKVYDGDRGKYYSSWQPTQEGIWSIEPSRYSGENPASMLSGVDMSILENPKALQALAGRLSNSSISAKSREVIARLIADMPDTTSCSAELKKALEGGETIIKCYALMALGSSTDAKIRDLVMKSLDSGDLATRRAAYLAAERSSDTTLITRMLEILQDADQDSETRLNAAYTMEQLTKGACRMNVFLPVKERNAQIDAAKKWWEENRATYKIKK